MEYPICTNPRCKSYGSSHPNCQCAPQYHSEGGEVTAFCSEGRDHDSKCEYFAEGGEVDFNNLSGIPQESKIEADAKEAQFGGLGNEILAAGEGLANTVTGGLYSVAAKKADEALGMDPTFHESVREQNPNAYSLGQLGGLLAGVGAPKGIEALTKGMAVAPKLAIENALFTLGDEVSKSVSSNPDSIQTGLMHVGLSGILGGVTGKVLGKASDLWIAKFGKDADKFATGFVGKLRNSSEESIFSKGPFPNFPPAPGTSILKEAEKVADDLPFTSTPERLVYKDGKFTRVPIEGAEPVLTSHGEKAADFIIKQASKAATSAAASGIGAAFGHLTGIPGAGIVGAMLGNQAKPVIATILPSIIKPLLKTAVSGPGLRAAFEAVDAVAKGDALLNKAAKSVFELGSSKLDFNSDKSKLSQLDIRAADLQEHPEAMMGVGGDLGHYMPNHQTSLASTAQNAVNYINTQKPRPMQPGVLDKKLNPSADKLAEYDRMLSIAEQPLVILQHLKNGTLRPKDVQDLKALYPALVPGIIQKLNNHMIDHLSKEKPVPFKLRKGLSLLMGQPMDSTFTQPSMFAAQLTFMPTAPPQMPPKGSSGGNRPSKVGRSAEMALTPNESRIKALSKA